ncbi:MAG: type II secretion system protein GspL, partial [Aquabacterium sp.]|nr:type II secretion system protein GspL [Aquabacterium sp.]
MMLLVILLPAPPRADAPPPAEPAPWVWLLSPDGLAVAQRGSGPTASLPTADTVVAVAPAESVAWHRPVCPKAPANRLRAALGGLLEERLLTDDDDVHLALAPKPQAGAPVWVAAMHKPWLRQQLAQLAVGGRVVDRLVPALAPQLDATADTAAAGHFHGPAEITSDASMQLAWSDADGAANLPLTGGLARSLLAPWQARGATWSATPAAAAIAERWLGTPVAVRNDADMALAAVRSPWNLLQFDLSPRHRGSLAAGNLWRTLMGPAWAPARWGLAALVLVQVVGINALAWQQRSALAQQRSTQDSLLRSAHPQVRAVLDAPLQMQRETAALRGAAGVPGDDDFETLLQAAASAWPDGQPPAAQLRFEPGQLSLPAAGWAPPQVDALRQRLAALGWGLDQSDGRLVIRKAS